MSWLGVAYAKWRGNKPVRISDYRIENHEKEFYYTVSCDLRMPNKCIIEEYADLPGRPFPTIDVPSYELNRRIKKKYPNAVL